MIVNSLKRGKTPEQIEDVIGVSMKEIEDCKKQLGFTQSKIIIKEIWETSN